MEALIHILTVWNEVTNMKKKDITSKDLLLCFLYSSGINSCNNEPIVGRTKLTKMMYLFEKEIIASFFNDNIEITLPEFVPYYFGPFSKQLFEDLSFFQSIGMIIAEKTNIPLSFADKVECDNAFDSNDDIWDEAFFESEYEYYESSYYLSESGKKYVEENIWNYFTDMQKDKLKAFKAQINRISLDALLRYVYTKYPEDAKKSKIADKYLNKADS